MPSLDQIVRPEQTDWYHAKAGRILNQVPKLRKPTVDFLATHGFTNLEFFGRGTNSLVFRDLDNPKLAVRIAIGTETHRVASPYLLQAIYTTQIQNPPLKDSLKIELLPLLSKSRKDFPPEQWETMAAEYEKNAKTCGYRFDEDGHIPYNCAIFSYPDPANPRKTKEVLMGADAGMIVHPLDPQVPTCLSGYPPLDIQWKEQCKIVYEDARLRKLVGIPAKLPTTKIIPIITPDGP